MEIDIDRLLGLAEAATTSLMFMRGGPHRLEPRAADARFRRRERPPGQKQRPGTFALQQLSELLRNTPSGRRVVSCEPEIV